MIVMLVTIAGFIAFGLLGRITGWRAYAAIAALATLMVSVYLYAPWLM